MKLTRRNLLGLVLSTLVPAKRAVFSSGTISKYNPVVLKLAMNSMYGKIGNVPNVKFYDMMGKYNIITTDANRSL